MFPEDVGRPGPALVSDGDDAGLGGERRHVCVSSLLAMCVYRAAEHVVEDRLAGRGPPKLPALARYKPPPNMPANIESMFSARQMPCHQEGHHSGRL